MELTDLIPPISGDPLMDAAQQWSSHYPWREPVVEEETRNKPDSGAGGCAISTKEMNKEGKSNKTGEGKKDVQDEEGDWVSVELGGQPIPDDSSSLQSSGVIIGETQVREKF